MSTDRKSRADLLRGREVRRLPAGDLKVRTINGEMRINGLASSTNSPYDMGWYTETISRGAFKRTLGQSPDVQLLINHEGLPLARTTNGTLDLAESDRGLSFDARLDPDDPDAARMARKVDSGLMDQCSFAFRVVDQTWDEDYTNRDIREVSLDRGDVSVVNYGANPNTSVTMRSLFDDLSNVSDEEIEGLREDPTVLTVLRRLAPQPYTPAALAAALTEVRAGAALSTAAVATLKHVLSLASTADDAVDEAQVVLSQFLGVANPDTDDAAPADASAPQQNAMSLDLAKARAYALRLRTT